MIKTNKWLKVSSALAALAAVPYVFFYTTGSWNSVPFIPQPFLEARARGSVFAENIIKLTEKSLDNLKLISDEDRAGNYSRGIDLIIGELSRNEITRLRMTPSCKRFISFCTFVFQSFSSSCSSWCVSCWNRNSIAVPDACRNAMKLEPRRMRRRK